MNRTTGTFSGNTVIHDRSLSIATLIMMGSVLLSRFFGLFREIVFARYGGTSYQMDAYVTAFIIPELLNHFLAGGFLSITFIPIFQHHFSGGRTDEAWRTFSNLFSIGSVLFAVFIPCAMFAAPYLISLLGPRITGPESYRLTVKLTRIILPAQIFFFWGAFFNAVQYTQKKFLLPAIAPLAYNVGIILGGIMLAPEIGIEGFAWGVLVGAFFGNVILQLPGVLRCGMKFTISFDFRHPDVALYMKKTVPLVLGLSMTYSNEIFFRFFGSFLPDGSTSSVNYALRTMMMVVAVFGQASGVAFYPFLAKLAAERKYGEMQILLNGVLRKIAVFLIPISAISILLARPIIAVLYERGRFDARSTDITASVFSIYLAGSFAFCTSMILPRAFYAMQNTILPMSLSTMTSIFTVPLYIAFGRIAGARGIALAAVTGMAIQSVILYWIWRTRFRTGQNLKEDAAFYSKIVAVTLAASLFGVLLRFVIEPHITFENVLLRNSLLILGVSVPVLCVILILYDRWGVQRFSTLFRSLSKQR